MVVHAYEKDGPRSVARLNGLFAFALGTHAPTASWPLAIPSCEALYWWSDGRRVAVASEIQALLATGLVAPEVDPVALDHYLACRFVPAPRTLFAGIHKLPPASLLHRVGEALGQRVREQGLVERSGRSATQRWLALKAFSPEGQQRKSCAEWS